jgi:uncharacterized peroxidase-related enzyme
VAVPSRFPVPDLDALPEDLRRRILEVQEQTGFVPNVFLVMAYRPKELRAFLALHDALVDSDVGLSKADRELIIVATSAANDCLYCVVAHGAILRIRARQPELSDQVATNYRKAKLTERQHLMVEFALKVADESAAVEDADIDRLFAAGFTRDEVWDIGAITALFAFSNRMANFTGMMPNPEFYAMGR